LGVNKIAGIVPFRKLYPKFLKSVRGKSQKMNPFVPFPRRNKQKKNTHGS
jgi:hypothetical protein